MIVVGEADPLAVAAEDVDVRPAAEGAGGERGDNIAGVEVLGFAGAGGVDDHALAMMERVLPIRRGVFGAEDEGDAIVDGRIAGDAAVGAMLAFVENFNAAGGDVDALDARAVECGAGGVAADVVDDPRAVG